MGVAEGYIGEGNLTPDDLGRRGHLQLRVGEGGSSDRVQRVIANEQALADAQAVADGEKGLALALLRALPVADVQGGGVVIAGGQSSAHTRIHSSAQQHYSRGFIATIGHAMVNVSHV